MEIDDNTSPCIILIGGSNGSGKTTIARQVEDDYKIPYLGADDIAAQLDPAEVGNVELNAARIFINRLKECIESKQSVIVESTLSGVTLGHHLTLAKIRGFRVALIYVYISSVELSLLRIATRVASGGHDVPERDVRRRFLRSRKNFWETYRLIADNWELIYNSPSEEATIINGQKVALADVVEDGENLVEQMSVIDQVQFDFFLESFGGVYEKN